eukprot:snap_masked-scaffold_52-processed-gene-1.80-mRNA-1 protein AED:1.00 eAED:1.00 QI:0/0/0/0/1/1/2/0/68
MKIKRKYSELENEMYTPEMKQDYSLKNDCWQIGKTLIDFIIYSGAIVAQTSRLLEKKVCKNPYCIRRH